MLLTDALPELAEQLASGFRREELHALANQIASLELIGRCQCGDDFCATIYTQPDGTWEGQLVERFVPVVLGLSCVYTVNGVIARIELLWRPEIRDKLNELFAPAGEQV